MSTVTFLPNFLLHVQQLCLEPPSLLATAPSQVSVLLVCIHCCILQLLVPRQMASSFHCSGFGTHRMGPDTQSSETRPENNPLSAVLPSSWQGRGHRMGFRAHALGQAVGAPDASTGLWGTYLTSLHLRVLDVNWGNTTCFPRLL